MAIIYSYPTKPTPALTDLVLITDSESTNPKNQTKNATLQSIADLIDDEVTLQEVLDNGNTATGANANITISGDLSSNRATITSTATIANVTTSSSAIQSSSDLTISNTTGQLTLSGPNQINLTSSNAGIVLTTGGAANDDISLQAGGNGDIIGVCNTFDITSKGTSIDSTAGTTTIIGDGAISIGNTSSASVNLRSEAGVSITAPTPATADVDGTVVFRGPDGVVDRPTYGFSNNVESGMYYDQAQGYVKVSVDANDIHEFESTLSHVVAANGLALPNMGSGGSSTGFALSRYSEGTFSCELNDNGAALPGLTYTINRGIFQCINNRVTGSIKIYVTGITGPSIPVAAGLGVGDFIVTSGPVPYVGANLLTLLPPDSQFPGNITFSECLGFTGLTAADAPVAGVSVTGATNYFLFKKYADASSPDTNLENTIGNFPNGIILTFDFSYNVSPP